MLSIELNGFETPGMLRAMMSALRAYVDGATEEYILTRGQPGPGTTDWSSVPPPVDAAAPVAADVPAPAAAEVVAAEKPSTRRKRAPAAEEVKAESAETATADQSAVIAEARAQLADDGKPAAEVKIEDLRAVAKLFNTDELREVARAILEKHEAASVTALAERDNIIRVSALADFQAAATQHNLA